MHSLAAARFPIAANTGRRVKVPECDAAYLPPPLSSVSGDEWTCGPRELFTSSLRHRSYDRHRPPLSYRHEPRKGRNAAAARTTLTIDGWGGRVRCAKVLTAITALPRRPLAERTGRVTTKCTYGRTIAGCERVSRRRRACVPPRSEERRWTEIGLKTEASRTVAGKDRGTTEREKRKTDRLRIRTGRGETVAAETGTDRTLLEPVMFGRSSGEQPIVAIAAPPVPPPPPPPPRPIATTAVLSWNRLWRLRRPAGKQVVGKTALGPGPRAVESAQCSRPPGTLAAAARVRSPPLGNSN